MRVGGHGIEAREIEAGGAVFIVVAHDDGAIEFADDFEALFRVRPVADDVAEADVMRAFLLLGMLEDDLQRFQDCVDVAENRVFHGIEVGLDCLRETPAAGRNRPTRFPGA